MPAIVGLAGTIVNMSQAVTGTAVGYPVYASQASIGATSIINSYNSELASSPAAALASTVLNNLFINTANGVPAASVTALTAALTQAFQVYPTAKGQVISNLTSILGTLETDVTFGSAAVAFNNQAAANFTYSTNPVNQFSGRPSATQTFQLTTNIDTFNGSAGNDLVTGVAGTLNPGDTINGGTGLDTLTLALTAAYNGGATITNMEVINLNMSTAGGFNATGIAGITNFNSNASTENVAVTNIGSLANIGVSNQDTNATFTYTDAAVSGLGNSVTVDLNNVGQAAAMTLALNNTSTVSGNTGIETLTINASGNNGTSLGANGTVFSTNALSSLTTINLTGSGANALVLSGSANTTATTINGSTATGNIVLGGTTASNGLGSASHNVTLGSGNDTVNFNGTLTTADTVNGGTGNDTLGSTSANWNTLNSNGATLTNVTNIERLFVNDDSASGVSATINAALIGASNLRLAAQASSSSETVTVNNLGGTTGLTSDIRLDGSVAGVTLNLTDATLPGTANVVNLELRGTSTTYTFTMQGVETINANLTNAATAATLALTNTALTTLNVTNAGAASFDTGTLGTNVSVVNLSGVTGTGTNTVTMTASASTGVSLTGSLNADTVVATNNIDIINGGGGSDVITGLEGGDRINVGSGAADNVKYTATGETFSGAVTSGSTALTGVDIITGMGIGDLLTLYSGVGISSSTALQTTLLSAGSTNVVAFVLGSYNSTTGIFTTSDSGTDTLVQWDTNGSTSSGAVESVVLVGFAADAATFGTNTITFA